MSVSSTTNRSKFTGNGSTGAYAYGFRIFANTDLKVTVRLIAAPFTETTLTLTTDYTVDGIGNSSGNVNLVDASQAWMDGSGHLRNTYYIIIRRVRPLTQTTSIRNQTTFFAATHEDVFDQLVMIAQQLQDEASRAVMLPETFTSSDFDPTLPKALPGSASVVLVTKSDGSGFAVGPTSAQISGANASAVAAAASAAAAAASAAASALAAPQVIATKAAPYSVVAGTTIPITTPTGNMIYFLKGGSGAVISSATPAIANGSATGQRLVIWGCDDTNTVTLKDASVVTNNNLDLNGTWVGNNGSKLELIWDNGSGIWSELSRSER